MATKNSERAGKSRVFGFTDAISPACLSWSESIVSRRVCRFRSRAVVELENLALRHQLHVLRRQRPSVEREIRDLIRQMSSANPLWGAPRIHGELLKLGVEVSQATVAKFHGAKTRCTFLDLAQLPAESRPRHRCDRHVRCGVRIVSAPLCDDHSGPRSQEYRARRCHRASERSVALAPGDRSLSHGIPLRGICCATVTHRMARTSAARSKRRPSRKSSRRRAHPGRTRTSSG